MKVDIIPDGSGGHYKAHLATDIEFVSPLEYYRETVIKLGISLAIDEVSHLAIPNKDKFIYTLAHSFWQERYDEISKTVVPNNLMLVLTAQSKSEQVKLLQGLGINLDQFLAFMFRAYKEYQYTFSQYKTEHPQTGVDQKDMPIIAHRDGDDLKKVGSTKMTDGQILQAIDHRKGMVVKILDHGNDWHCFFINYASLAGKESWKAGQSHYHYVSSKFGMTRDYVLAELMKKEYKLGSLPHIDLLDYGNQTGH